MGHSIGLAPQFIRPRVTGHPAYGIRERRSVDTAAQVAVELITGSIKRRSSDRALSWSATIQLMGRITLTSGGPRRSLHASCAR